MNKLLENLIETLTNLNRRAKLEQAQTLDTVLRMEKILNQTLPTRQKEPKQAAIQRKEAKKEQQLIKKEHCIVQGVEDIINEAQQKIKQVSQEVNKQIKPKNYHYQPNGAMTTTNNIPPKPATKPPTAKKPSTVEQQRSNSVRKTKQLVAEKEEIKAKRESLTGKVTQLPPPMPKNQSKSIDKKMTEEEFQKVRQMAISNSKVDKTESNKQRSRDQSRQLPKEFTKQQQKQPIKTDTPNVVAQLYSFTRSKEQLQNAFSRQHSKKPLNLNPFMQSYRKEEMGYRQDEQRNRLSFLKQLTKYGKWRSRMDCELTHSIEKRGWKGCDYVSVIHRQLTEIDEGELEKLVNSQKTPNTLQLFEKYCQFKSISQNFLQLMQEKSHLEAPQILPIKFVCQPVKKNKTSMKVSKTNTDSYMLPILRQSRPILQLLLEISIGKPQLKILLQMLNLIIADERKSFVVIANRQLSDFLRSLNIP